MDHLYRLRYSILAAIIGGLVLSIPPSAFSWVLFPLGFILFFGISEVIRHKAQTEWSWAIIAVVVLDIFFVTLAKEPSLMAVFAVIFLPLKLVFLHEGLRSMLDITAQQASILTWSIYATLLTSITTYATLVIKYGLDDTDKIRRYVRRAALILIVAAFGLTSYACEHVSMF